MDIKHSYPTQNFGAKYITTTKIKEKHPLSMFFRNIDVDIVELKRTEDIPSIKNYVASDPHCTLGTEFLVNFQDPIHKENYRAFAITRQRYNHKELNPKDILGFCDGFLTYNWRDGNIFFIQHLETTSINNKHRPPKKKNISFFGLNFQITEQTKGIGKAILRNIIKINGDDLDSIELEAMPTSKNFYRHIGFVDNCINNPDHFCLPRHKFNKLKS
ncbi:MAG: GNAT family N-acetyltransferase [Fusobacterium sp.]|nr:GNAT family N-acetyltransferase [Fusobacterium sp.]